jgi:hypothetical protein
MSLYFTRPQNNNNFPDRANGSNKYEVKYKSKGTLKKHIYFKHTEKKPT